MTRRSAEHGPARYIESSALIAALLERDIAARNALDKPGQCITSALTLTEAKRAIVRASHQKRLTRDQEMHVSFDLRELVGEWQVVDVTDDILGRAGNPFPVEPVRALDAIHLATIEHAAEYPQLLTVITRDLRVRANAIAMGFGVA